MGAQEKADLRVCGKCECAIAPYVGAPGLGEASGWPGRQCECPHPEPLEVALEARDDFVLPAVCGDCEYPLADCRCDPADLSHVELRERAAAGHEGAIKELDHLGFTPEPLELDADPIIEATTDVNLTMSPATVADLHMRAQIVASETAAAAALREALEARTYISDNTCRVTCDGLALRYIRQVAPDVARRWPAVFGDVEVPRNTILAQISVGAVGRAIVGIDIDANGVMEIVLDGAKRIVIKPDGTLDWLDADLDPREDTNGVVVPLHGTRSENAGDPRGDADR